MSELIYFFILEQSVSAGNYVTFSWLVVKGLNTLTTCATTITDTFETSQVYGHRMYTSPTTKYVDTETHVSHTNYESYRD